MKKSSFSFPSRGELKRFNNPRLCHGNATRLCEASLGLALGFHTLIIRKNLLDRKIYFMYYIFSFVIQLL